MGIHQQNENRLPDEHFLPGSLEFLVAGNCCRLLDGRRTPGRIEEYFPESAMFRWRIIDFEDKGKYWDLPAEKVKSLQFDPDSSRLGEHELQKVREKIEQFRGELQIEVTREDRQRVNREVARRSATISCWLEGNSNFFQQVGQLNPGAREGSKLLAADLKQFFREEGLLELEERTAGLMVLNPNSGEWIKGMKIVMGEMGLQPCSVPMPRTEDIFSGIGRKERRREYILNRLGFIRAYFQLLGQKEVVLYRGMAAEGDWGIPNRRTFSSWTFSLEVARSFADLDRSSKFKHSYLVKRSFPVEKLWMTYLETAEMNKQYLEAEAIVLHDNDDRIFY
ncbi:MAG: hypothetical protein UMV23_01170 [Halanaerobium sp.]|nr:hypothetical protein [Halanaerobium sp.]